MKKIFRYLGATLLLLLAIASFGIFEYWKLIEPGSRYLFAGTGAGVFFFASLFLFLPLQASGWKECLKYATYLTLVFFMLEFSFLKWKGRSELNHLLNAKGRCESVAVTLVKDRFDSALQNAQNLCTLRLLQDSLHDGGLDSSLTKIVQTGSLLQAEGRLNETTFVLLLSFYATKISESSELNENANDGLASLKTQIDLLEGTLPLFESYTVKPVDEEAGYSESIRMKKLVEISTLAKTLNVFLGKARAGETVVEAMTGQSGAGLKLPSGELTLVQMRMQKVLERFNRVQKKWNLLSMLKGLNLKAKYPDEVEKVREEIGGTPAAN